MHRRDAQGAARHRPRRSAWTAASAATSARSSAILDDTGEIATRLKTKEVPKAEVDPDLCTGCVFCVDVCPYNALSMVDYDSAPGVNMVAVVDQDKCMGCDHLCTSVCIKDAIELHFVTEETSAQEQPIGA